VQNELGAFARIIYPDFDLDPAHIPDTCAERLGNGLLGGQAGSQARRLVVAVLTFTRCKKAVEKAFAQALNTASYPFMFNHVNSTAQHLRSLLHSGYNPRQLCSVIVPEGPVMNNRLASALKFSEDDLERNRSGRISDAQRARFTPPPVSRIAIYVVLGHAVLLVGVLGGIAMVVNEPALWVILLIVGALAMLPFFAARSEFVRRPLVQDDVNRGRVASVCGVVELPAEDNRYHIRVDGVEFRSVTLKVWGAFSPQRAYCIYYLPQTRIILSAEEMT